MAEDINKLRKAAEAYKNAIIASEKSMLEMEKTIGKIGSDILNLTFSDFFSEVERSPEMMKKLEEEIQLVNKELDKSAGKINKAFKEGLKSSSIKTMADFRGELDKIDKKFPDLRKQTATMRVELEKAGSVKNFNLTKFLKNAPEGAGEVAKALIKDKDSMKAFDKELDASMLSFEKFKELIKELNKTTIATLDLGKAFEKFITKTFSLSKIFGIVTNYDKIITDAQKATGIQFTKNTEAMSKMTVEAARFGMSAKDVADFMGQVGDSLNTTNFDILGKAAVDTKAISLALGVSSTEVGEMTSQFMLMGKSSEDVVDFSKEISDESKKFGLNSKKVFGDINKNLPKFRQMGFQGGEESLKKMVITAQKLRMNVDEIFNVAEKARSIEGAMEMAAELQLAGGSFAQIDPMQLLSAARKSPEELTKILGQMGGDIGTFAKNAKGEMEMTFSPVDADRLKMVADATSMTVDSLQKQISKAKQRAFKETEAFSKMPGLSEETKDMLDQFSEVGKDGKITFSGAFKDMDIGAIRNLSQKEIKQRVEDYENRKDTLEKSALENKSFTDSLTDLKNSFMNIFTAFEPFIRGLTDLLNKVNGWPYELKLAIGFGAAALALIFGPAKAFINGILMAKGFQIGMAKGGIMEGIKGLFGGKKSEDMSKKAVDVANKSGKANLQGSAGIKRTLQDIANGIKAFGNTKVLFGALNLIPSAIGLTLMTPSLPFLLGIGSVGKDAGKGLKGVASGVKAFGNTKALFGAVTLIPAALGLVLMTAALPFLIGIALIGEAAGVGLSAFAEGLSVFGEAMSAAAPAIFVGELLLAGFGVALIPLTYALSLLSPLIDSFGKIIIGVFSAIPPVITAIAEGIVTVSEGFTNMATSLIPLAPGLYLLAPALIASAFGFSALFLSFANPVAMVGMFFMLRTIGSLNNIMTTLAPNLETGAASMTTMAEGVTALSTAMKSLDTDKLEKLQTIGNGIEGTSALMTAVNMLTSAVSGGDNGKTQKFEIEVIVKNENGREIQRKIIKDNELTH